MADRIALVESTYDLTPEPGAWLEQVVAHAAPLLDAGDAGAGVTGMVFDVTPSTFRVEQVCSRGPSELKRFALTANQTAAPEARLSPAGELCDARAPATAARPRVLLREAVQRTEQARGSLRRRDPDEALDLWQGLVAGRWSLVDHYDQNGRRFVVALPNDPELRDPRGLSRRERQVAEFVGMGRASKEIAYVLGVSASAVDNVINRIRHKLGLASRAEVVVFFAPRGLRAHLTQLAVAGETLLVGSVPLRGCRALTALTPAEGEVAVLLLQGYTNAAIAAGRSTAVRTVANQVQAIFSKVGVGSRAELAATIQAGSGDLGRGA